MAAPDSCYKSRDISAGALGIAVVQTADMYGDDFKWKNPPYEYEYDKNPFDLIAGTSKVREAIERGDSLDSIRESWHAPLAEFRGCEGFFPINMVRVAEPTVVNRGEPGSAYVLL